MHPEQGPQQGTEQDNDADWIITKRLLGVLLAAVGILGAGAILLLDRVRGGAADFGPTQALALAGAIGLVILGLTLIPLGGRPA